MAANTAGMRVEGTTVTETGEQQAHGRTSRKVGRGMAAALVAAMLIGGVALHDRGTSSSVAPAPGPVVTYEQIRFQEWNTIFPIGASSAYMEDETPAIGQNR